jgi:hypothetical protein
MPAKKFEILQYWTKTAPSQDKIIMGECDQWIWSFPIQLI